VTTPGPDRHDEVGRCIKTRHWAPGALVPASAAQPPGQRRRTGSTRRPHQWAGPAVLGLGYLTYEWLRAALDHPARLARAHAAGVYQIEQMLHADVEHWCNGLLTAHPLAAPNSFRAPNFLPRSQRAQRSGTRTTDADQGP
jgi:hypothetical protein